ncbi:MAG TPA: C-terminal binding protein, partial [Nonomuraea sp.]|nr:C-terminal binding protein [Nonomuraea sp.]
MLTDHPWPDLDIERSILSAAGIELVAGPMETPDAATVEKLVADADPDAILTCWAPVTAAAIEQPKNVRLVARLGVGLDNIAVAAATARGAWVTNVPDYCVSEVSDHAVALVLAHGRGIVDFDRAAKRGRWDPSQAQLTRISELTVGIIGFGRIGRETGRKLSAFGCRVLAHSRSLVEAPAGVTIAPVTAIQDQADVIILHAPLSPETEHLVDRAFLAACRRRPLLVNVSRGGLVDNGALLEALDSGSLRGAAIDVLEGEPRPPREILTHPRAIVTPHIAFSSSASLRDLRRRACEEVVRVLGGE